MLSTTDSPCYAAMVELSCGSAVLSASAAAVGLHAYPVDHASNKFTPFLAPLNVDLGSPEGRTWAKALISLIRPVWLRVGMPCGTGSRARDRPVPRRLQAEGAPAPRPLRSALHPWVFPGSRCMRGIAFHLPMPYTRQLCMSCTVLFSTIALYL